MARYQGMSFETQRMMRDAVDFAKKRRLKQDELEQQKIDAMKSASDSAANAEITKTRMMLDAEKDKDREKRLSEWNRGNDAFEVSAGRMDPALFNMKYGGGAAQPSGAQRTAGDAQGANRQEYMKHLIEAYKAESDAMAGAGQTIPDFSTFMANNLEAVKSQYPDLKPDDDPWEARRRQRAMDAGKRPAGPIQFNKPAPLPIRKPGVTAPINSISPKYQKPVSFGNRAFAPQRQSQPNNVGQPPIYSPVVS